MIEDNGGLHNINCVPGFPNGSFDEPNFRQLGPGIGGHINSFGSLRVSHSIDIILVSW
jgi:hypothetical protein